MTGGTGFVGSHTVAALVRHGHEVRVMARRPEAVARVLEPLGVIADAVRGDVTDPRDVATALDGCDAVVHAAAHVGVSTGVGADGQRQRGRHPPRPGPGRAAGPGSGRLHVERLDLPAVAASGHRPDSPLSEPLSPYTASKSEAELLVRAVQAQGHPVTSIAIGGVYGPHSPHLDSSFAGVLGAMRSMMLVPPGGIGVVDVRDTAELLARAVRPGSGPRRYLAGGTYVTWSEWVDLLSDRGRDGGRPARGDGRRDGGPRSGVRPPAAERGPGEASAHGGGGDRHDELSAHGRLVPRPVRSRSGLPTRGGDLRDTVECLRGEEDALRFPG